MIIDPLHPQPTTTPCSEVLLPGESRVWNTTWYARTIPSDADASVGNTAIYNFAECIANCHDGSTTADNNDEVGVIL